MSSGRGAGLPHDHPLTPSASTPEDTVHTLTATLDVPGARLHHEVRGDGPLVVLFGTPMGADAFAGLADLLAVDHTVLTTDTRGIGRSPVDDPDATPTLATRADDVAALVRHVDPDGALGPVTVLGSSGGAVTALALAENHPGLVDTVVAHEPPLVELLADRDERHAGEDVVIERWFAGDHLGSWRAFLANAAIEMPEEMIADDLRWRARPGGPRRRRLPERPPPAADDALPAGPRGPPRRTAPGSSWASARTPPASSATAAPGRWPTALGIEPTLFPGDHIGFAEDPVAFEPVLRSVLPGSG